MRHALFATLTLIAALTATSGAVAGHHLESEKTPISKLSWMTGSWSGDIGGSVLEENWTEAKAGSIAALVRITSPEGTAMVEIVKGTLVLHIQQWDPGFVARAEAQKMVLDSMGEQRVSFVAASSGGLKKLGYTLTEAGQFLIEVTTAENQEMTLPVAAMQR